jgi:hypothetical protein
MAKDVRCVCPYASRSDNSVDERRAGIAVAPVVEVKHEQHGSVRAPQERLCGTCRNLMASRE